MSIERTKSKQKVKEPKTKITWKEIKRQKVLLFWAAIMVVYGVVFYYLPLAGWTMAFQNYKPRLGIFHSEFVGWDKFRTLFSDMTFIRVIRNTLAMGVINLVVTFITAIVFAILLNEIKSKGGKKVVQTISYLPHFLSWIIVTGILHDMLSGGGIVNELLLNFLPYYFTADQFLCSSGLFLANRCICQCLERNRMECNYLFGSNYFDRPVTLRSCSYRRCGKMGKNQIRDTSGNQTNDYDSSSDECR